MDDETPPNHLFISLRHEFKATRVSLYNLTPVAFKIKCDVSVVDTDEADFGFGMQKAQSRLNAFVSDVLDESVIISSDNEWAIDCFMGDKGTDNTIVLCPEEPTDALLVELLLCKFTALAQGRFDFHSMEIESSDNDGMGFTFVGMSPGDSFPDSKEWLTERNFFSRPWWDRDDASSQDVTPHEDDDLNSPPIWAYSFDHVTQHIVALDPSTAPGLVIYREFRPKLIEGGKTD